MEISTPRSVTTRSSSGKHLSITPGSRVLRSPLSDEEIWKRLRDAGFDEESIKQKDKAALVAYIAKLEAEVRKNVLPPLSNPSFWIFFLLFIAEFGIFYFYLWVSELGELFNWKMHCNRAS